MILLQLGCVTCSYMLFFAIFVGKITLVCLLSPTAPPGDKLAGLSSLNEILMASVTTVQSFMHVIALKRKFWYSEDVNKNPI